MESLVARKTWRTVEPIHGIVYFARERLAAYDRLGVSHDAGYFVTRSAAMGAVPADVVIATFFNFHPAFVRASMEKVWEQTTAGDAVRERFVVADEMLRRLIPADAWPAVEAAAELARRAAERACERPEGRPLFAGHASIAWPSDGEPHLVLWHAQTLLREFRGDAHIAAMTAEGVSGPEALVIHAGTGDITPNVLQSSRRWPDSEWEATCEGLRARGWLDDKGALTGAGRAHREWVEDRTDALSVYAYEALGNEECERLRGLARPLSQAIVSSGELGFRAGR
jgi:hypothetical protein